MAGRDFLEEQRRRQRELIAVKTRRQNPEAAAPVETAAPEAPLTFNGKLKNFWFYYKYYLLAGLFLAFTLTVGITQCVTREKFDSQVVLFTYHTYTTSQMDAIEVELEKYGTDLNNDGAVNIQIIDCAYGENELFDQTQAKATKLTATIASNQDALLFITDDETFEYLNNLFDTAFFDNLGLSADDGRSVYFDEEFYNSVNAAAEGFLLPEGLKISRRVAGENTVIAQKGDLSAQLDAASALLEKLNK